MKLVIIESPYAGDVVRNIVYARACVCDALFRNEAPFLSHLLYTQDGILRDRNSTERTHGINAGFAWGEKAELRAFYIDYGMSSGMVLGKRHAEEIGQASEERRLSPETIHHVECVTLWLKNAGVTEETIWGGGINISAIIG